MLAKCANCEFYLSPDEKFCRNCGLSSPTEDMQDASDHAERNLTIIFTLISAIICGFVFTLLRNDGDFTSLGELPVAILISLVPCFAFSYFFVVFVLMRLEKRERQRRFAYTKVDVTLNDIQDTVMLRSHELDEKYRETEEFLTESENLEQNEAGENLESEREAIAALLARYELQHLKINTIRLQNDLLPIFHEENISENRNDFLNKINDALLGIKNMRQSLAEDNGDEFPEAVLSEKENFLAHLEEIKKSCEKLRESLLNSGGTPLLQSVLADKKSLDSSGKNDSSSVAEIFNIQTNLAELSKSFEEVERDYQRLKAENII